LKIIEYTDTQKFDLKELKMGYEAFFRKYRPKNFDEVVGQESIVRTLRNAIKLDRISHAYIFAGSRGLGKTTISRIITKCLNCETGITDQPCGKCENCLEIDRGSFPDLYEIDAASNRGIDDIRNIKENVSYAPIKGRYKVYIIDEAHMLTREAFNALLKTLEEPPPHNIFILATTELHKIPDTIRSRCQTFIFKPPHTEEIVNYLKRIAENENLEFEEDALRLLAEASEGGMRDAASLLDQASVYGMGKITKAVVEEMLGFVPERYINEFFKYLKELNFKKLIALIEKLDKEGYDLNIFWEQILKGLHNSIINLVQNSKDKYFSEEDLKNLIYIETIFNKAFQEAKLNQNVKGVYELAVLKLKYLENLISIKELLEKGVKTVSPKSEGAIKTNVEEKIEDKFSLKDVINKIKKEEAIVGSILARSEIQEDNDKFIIKIDKSLAPTVKEKIEVINKYFPKNVVIEEIEIKKESKTTKRDESVDKILSLFNGKIISYKEKKKD